MKHLIGLDIGGTNISSALISVNGKIIKKNIMPTEGKKGRLAVIKNIKKSIKLLMRKDVIGIGIGSPGPLDPIKGIIKTPKNIPLQNTRLKDIIEKEFRLPVKLENDANCFILGEAVFGSAKECSVVTGFTLGTGIGSAIVIDKKVVHGSGNAGEIGLSTINFDGLKSRYGNTGAIEEYISIRGIMRLAKGLDVKEPLDIYNLAKKGSSKAIKVFERYGKYLGIAVTNLIYAFDPAAIIIGGSISGSWRFFSKSMKAEIKKRAVFNNAKIYHTEETEKYAMLGAVCPLLKR